MPSSFSPASGATRRFLGLMRTRVLRLGWNSLGFTLVLSRVEMKRSILSIFVLILFPLWVNAVVLNFGQSCALTGPRQNFGIEMSQGILAAFEEANSKQTLPGITFNLTVLDDAYSEALAKQNTKDLVVNNDVFALLGQTGSETSVAALQGLDEIGASNVPFVGPQSGSRELRVPFRSNTINIRASFIDEVGAMVKYLVSRQITRISIFYQTDMVGNNVKTGLIMSLNASELTLESEGTVDYDSLNVSAGIDEVFQGHHVQALVMLAVAPAVGKAIDYARRTYPSEAADVLFLTPSYMNAQWLYDSLASYGSSLQNIYTTQTVPPPQFTNSPVANSYKTALQAYNSSATMSFKSFEGYLVGRFVIEAVDRIRGNLSRENFLEAIYRTRLFDVDSYILGPFSNDTASPCNQAAREVFLTQLSAEDHLWHQVANFSFTWSDTCLSSKSSIFSANRLVWGQTADLTGPSSAVGLGTSLGIAAAFAEANRLNRIPDHKFELTVLDDTYSPTRSHDNALSLLSSGSLFGLIGTTGTATSQAVLSAMASVGSALPFVGPVTGANALRTPFQRNLVNVRASYVDEVAAMVNFATNQLITRISIFYQNDPFGISGLQALQTAMNASGLKIESSGSYERGSSDVSSMSALLNGKKPGAVVIFGTYIPATQAIKVARASGNPFGANAIYLVVSTVGIDAFKAEMIRIGESLDNVYITQVVPSPYDASVEIVQAYQNALAVFAPDAVPSITSLEGYITGRLVVDATARIVGTKTPTKFLDSLYNSRLFVLNKLVLGPFIDQGSTSCNQGIRNIWTTGFNSSSADPFVVVPGSKFSWDTCVSATDDILRPVVFGQSAPLTGLAQIIGLKYRNGILTAFNEFNRNGGLDGRRVLLNTFDDANQPDLAVENTKEHIASGVLGLIGYVGTPTSAAASIVANATNVPFLGPYTGAMLFREPCSKYIVNVRASYDDEIAAIVSFLLDDKNAALRRNRVIKNIAMFYQSDSYGTYYKGAIRALSYRKVALSGLGAYPVNTLDVEAGLQNITSTGVVPDAIIVFGSYAPCSKFVQLAKAALPSKVIYMVMSNVGPTAFAAGIAAVNMKVNDDAGLPTVYLSSVVPSPTDASHPLAASYQREITNIVPYIAPNFIALEGYALGRFITRTLQLVEGEITYSSFVQAIYEKFMYNLDEYYLGPYTLTSTSASARTRSNMNATEVLSCTCSQGSHQIWVEYVEPDYNITQINDFEFIFDTCGVVFEVLILQQAGTAIQGIVLALSVVAIIIVLLCALLVILFRGTKTMTASSPAFLLMLLLGALLLSASPFFAVSWSPDESAQADSVCMAWIWMLGLGFTLFFAPLAVKTYRVYRIFNNRVLSHVITIKDSDLMLYLAVPVVMEVIILITWTAIAPAKMQTLRIPGTLDQTMQLCGTLGGADQPFVITQAVFFSLVAILACFFAFRTRNIKYGAFKESNEILFAAYNLTFLSVILVPLHAGLSFYVVPSTIIRTIGVIFQVLVSLGALFGMKLYRIITNNEKMSTTTRHSGFSSRGPLSFSSTSGSSRTRTKTSTSTTGTTTTTTTSSSSRTSSSKSSASTGSSTTSSSSSSSSDDDSNGSSTRKAQPKQPSKSASPNPKPQPVTRAKPGEKFNDSIMTEPSTEESSGEEEKKKKKKHKKDSLKIAGENNVEKDQELEEIKPEQAAPEPKKSPSILPKWLSPKSRHKADETAGSKSSEKERKPERVFIHHDSSDETEGSSETAPKSKKNKKKHYEVEDASELETKPLSPKQGRRKNKDTAEDTV